MEAFVLPYIVFGGLLLYAGWKVLATSMVLRVHADDPDDKMLLIPAGPDPLNPLVRTAGALRQTVRATRRRWLLVVLYVIVAFSGAFHTWGSAILGFIVTWILAALVNAAFARRWKII
jgi:hypothetical protein